MKSLFLLPCLILLHLTLHAQYVFLTRRYQLRFEVIYHHPNEEDETNVIRYGHLIKGQPDSTNFENYYEVACSLWDLNRTAEAEKMFLYIIRSNAPYYANTTQHKPKHQ